MPYLLLFTSDFASDVEVSAFECGEILAEAYLHCIPVSDVEVSNNTLFKTDPQGEIDTA